MIVRQEAKTIERCLRSITPHIACWAITDTGSSDDTPRIIERVMAELGIPGRLTFRPFDNFCNARNAAYAEVRNVDAAFDYVLLSDADMVLTATDPDWHKKLSAKVHSMPVRYADGKLEYSLTRIVHCNAPLAFRGVTHEYPDTTPHFPVLIDGAWFVDHLDGGCRGEKTERDIRLLTKGLTDEPGNVRYMFYLAQSYYFGGQREKAIEWYTRRIEAGPHGIPEEQFISGYRIAQCLQAMERWADFVYACWDLHQKFPHRAEPFNLLSLHYLQRQQNRLAYLVASEGARIPQPRADALFVEPEVYKWRLRDTMAVAAFYLGRREEALVLNRQILPSVPPPDHSRIEANIKLCEPQISNPVGRVKEFDLKRCLVVMTIGDREPAILKIRDYACGFETVVIDHSEDAQNRKIGAFSWKGHKWHNIAKLFTSEVVKAADFDYVWFPDDDVDISGRDAERLFQWAHNYNLQLCQPSLSADSACTNWPITKHVPGSEVRRTNFVEIMAPLFRMDALAKCLSTFTENNCGWGLDLIWPRILGDRDIGVIDAVQVKHTQMWSSPAWTLPSGKTPHQEMHETLKRHNMDFEAARAAVGVV